jgi:hypothetical protein
MHAIFLGREDSMLFSSVGRALLDRRAFLQHAGTGLAGIALSSLLAAEDRSPIRPDIRPENPLSPRKPHFEAKAKRVLMIFCTGAVSHVDTWDYKSELVKRDGQPLPGSEKLVTFQGENGNLVKPIWPFKPHGQSGKMISDLLPNLAELADEMCFVHSMTARSNTHGPGGSVTPSAASAPICRRSSPCPIRAAYRRSVLATGAVRFCQLSSRVPRSMPTNRFPT